MKRPLLPNTTKATKPHIKSLDEQQTDFTSEGAPPPGKVASARHATVAPAVPGVAQPAPAADDGSVGTVKSKKMRQALRDITRGLKDTDRGPEVDRTYKKLKH